MLFQITAAHFCAGLETDRGVVTKAAPIINYMKGWLFQAVEVYCKSKGWKITTLRE